MRRVRHPADERRRQGCSDRCRWQTALPRRDRADDAVACVRETLAVSTLENSERVLPSLRTSLDHVFIANSAQVTNGTLNVNEAIGLANASAHELGALFGVRARDHAASSGVA